MLLGMLGNFLNIVLDKPTNWPSDILLPSFNQYNSHILSVIHTQKSQRHDTSRTLHHAICTLCGRAPGHLGWNSTMDGSLCHQLAGGATIRLNAWLSLQSALIMGEHVNCECSPVSVICSAHASHKGMLWLHEFLFLSLHLWLCRH